MSWFERTRRSLFVADAIRSGLSGGLRTRPVIYTDIGARGGLGRPWQMLCRAGLLTPIFFEPEATAAAALRDRHPAAKIIAKAAWDEAGRHPLYVTRSPASSSLLKPSRKWAEAVPEMYGVAQVEDIATLRADACPEFDETPSEIILKIDVQGGEGKVLDGCTRLMSRIACCEIEVSFEQMYEDQPTFEQINQRMIDAGFGLFDIITFGVRSARNAPQANALFCRRDVKTERAAAIERMFLSASGTFARP